MTAFGRLFLSTNCSEKGDVYLDRKNKRAIFDVSGQ